VLLAHLQRGSLHVRAGDAVRIGDTVGACGNSGNSTQPHVHVQATDSLDWAAAHGVPISFPSLGASEGGLPRGRSPFVVPNR
jgi:Peptidase family M23